VSDIYESSVWELLHVTQLVPRILKYILDCWKNCTPFMGK